MNYWINLQWPCKDKEQTDFVESIWVKEEFIEYRNKIDLGDIVFIYQTKNGPKDDKTTKYKEGVEGIIAITNVIPITEAVPPQIIGNSTWIYIAQLQATTRRGYIPRTTMNNILNYDTNYVCKGFGDEHSGLKLINETTYDRLNELFR